MAQTVQLRIERVTKLQKPVLPGIVQNLTEVAETDVCQENLLRMHLTLM